MKILKIKEIANKVNKKFNREDEAPIVELKERGEGFGKEKFIEIRTELTSYEGGNEMMEEIEKKLGYECEYQGACVYNVYKKI